MRDEILPVEPKDAPSTNVQGEDGVCAPLGDGKVADAPAQTSLVQDAPCLDTGVPSMGMDGMIMPGCASLDEDFKENIAQTKAANSTLPRFGGGEKSLPALSAPQPTNSTSEGGKQDFKLPVCDGDVAECTITRERNMMGNYTSFTLRTSKEHAFLMAARKRKKSMTANYLISTDGDQMSKDSECAIGKVRALDMVPLSPGMLFSVYDGGENPKRHDDPAQAREELAFVKFEDKPVTGKPVYVAATIPALHDGTREVVKPEFYCTWTELELMSKKPEEHKDQISTFVAQGATAEKLTFVENSSGSEVMQFEKVGADKFSLTVQHPLSLLQAFGIALSIFDASCGALYGSTL